jgi:elongation factor Ts
MEKFFEQEVLLDQPFAKDPDKSVTQYLHETGGEAATVASFVSFRLGESAD